MSRMRREASNHIVRAVRVVLGVSALVGASLFTAGLGCSSSTEGAAPASEAGVEASAPRDANAAQPTCLNPAPVVTRYQYKPPTVSPSACTAKDLDDLVAYVRANPTLEYGALFEDAKTRLGATCVACIFAEASNATWPPVLLDQGRVASLNPSGCIEIVSGRGAECGRAHRVWSQCLLEACATCRNDDEDLDCRQAAQGTACLAQTEVLTASCGDVDAYNRLVSLCTGDVALAEWARRQCSSAVDGGVRDAAVDG